MKTIRRSFFAVFLLFFAQAAVAAPSPAFDERDPMLVEVKSEPHDWNLGQAGRLTLTLKLPAGYHAYEDKFSLEIMEPDGFTMAQPKISPLETIHDKFSKRDRRVVSENAVMTVDIEAPHRWLRAADKMVLNFVYQACSSSFCLFPTTKRIEVPIKTLGAPESAPAARPSGDQPETATWLSADKLQQLLGDNKILALFFVFLAGVLTSFTPCIFPMIPITLAVLGKGSERRSRAQNFLLSLCYVHGIALTYSLMGVLAATSGAMFGASLGNPWILSGVCVLLLAMSLSMYGLFEIQVPAFLRNTLGTKKTTSGYFGAFVTGMIAGVVASPCVGPVLVGILAWVATTGSKAYGFVLLFTYAMGLGLIFLLLGAFTELTRKLPRSGPWLETVKFVLGSLMLGAFYYYLSLLIPERWHDGALGLGLIVLGSVSGAFAPLRGTSALAKIRKGAGQALLVIGIGYLALATFDLRPALRQGIIDPAASHDAGGIQWRDYSEAALAQAAADGKPVLIDFWAEWCAACHELEQKTFQENRVKITGENFVALRFDATSDSPQLRELKKKWKIQGLPTVLFVNPNGVWLEDLTLTEFESADKFLPRMQKALN